jgi:transcription elongation factor Elf1
MSSIKIDGIEIVGQCPRCGGGNISVSGITITPRGSSGEVKCNICGHAERVPSEKPTKAENKAPGQRVTEG